MVVKLPARQTSMNVEVIPVPQLYMPVIKYENTELTHNSTKNEVSFETSVRAVSINPPIINSIIIKNLMVAPDQNFIPFRDYITNTLERYLRITFFEDRGAYLGHAGLHCRSFTIRK